MDLKILLMAAEYVERRDKEHGYASTRPPQSTTTRLHKTSSSGKRQTRHKKSQSLRSTHNELEKNRRAHMRRCLEKLKEAVPLGPDCSKHTTLGLLIDARSLIKCLEEKDKQIQNERESLMKEQLDLRKALSLLQNNGYRCRPQHTISESSSGSLSSCSHSSTSDEIDVTSCSGTSDLDDNVSGDTWAPVNCFGQFRGIGKSKPAPVWIVMRLTLPRWTIEFAPKVVFRRFYYLDTFFVRSGCRRSYVNFSNSDVLIDWLIDCSDFI